MAGANREPRSTQTHARGNLAFRGEEESADGPNARSNPCGWRNLRLSYAWGLSPICSPMVSGKRRPQEPAAMLC
jgi:hypothetical protein